VVTDSTLSKSSETYDIAEPKTIMVGMNLNGNALSKIKNEGDELVEGSDYTIIGTSVRLSPEYLATLQEGNNDLTFEFSAGADAEFTIKVIKTVQEEGMTAGIGEINAKAGEIITLPIILTEAPDQGIANFAYRIKYDPDLIEVLGIEAGDAITNPDQNFVSGVYENTKMISILFIDNALSEEETIKTAGTLSNIKIKIKDNAPSGIIPMNFNDDDHSFYDMDGNEIKVEFADGSINVE